MPYKNQSKRNRKVSKRRRNKYNSLDLYVVRLDLQDSMTCAKPCMYCSNTMKSLGVKRVFYSDWGGEIRMEYVSEMKTGHLSVFQEDLIKKYPYLPVNAIKTIRV